MKYLFALFFLLFVTTINAQDKPDFLVKNGIYAKGEYMLGGIGQYGGSINYERRLFKTNAFLGTGFIYYLRGVRGIPVELNYLFFDKNHHLETGISYVYGFSNRRDAVRGDIYSTNLAYRYENFSKRGISIKLGINPGIGRDSHIEGNRTTYNFYISFRTYVSIGFSF